MIVKTDVFGAAGISGTKTTGPEIGMRIRRFVVAASMASICTGPGFRFAYEWFMPS